MSSLIVPLDGIVGPHAKPLRDRLILLGLDGKRALDQERLLRWLKRVG